MGWDPRKCSLAEYVSLQRAEEMMSAYDDKVERRVEQGAALGLYWARPKAENTAQLSLTLTVHDKANAA